MEYDQLKEKIVLKKLHVSYEKEEETIFYKKPYTKQELTIITLDDKKHKFDLEQVTHLSLNNFYGLLIQLNNKSCSFHLKNIQNIMVK